MQPLSPRVLNTCFQVHRICFALSLFHLIIGALLIGVKDTRDKRAAIQNGYVLSLTIRILRLNFLKLVGPQDTPMAHPHCDLLLHSQRFLHVLGQLHRSHRCHNVHTSRSGPTRRLCSFVVGNMPRKLGKLELQPLAMDPHHLDGGYVRRYNRSNGRHVRVLRRFWVHSQQVLHLYEPRFVHPHHHSVYSPDCPRTQSTFGLGTIKHGRRLL